MGRYTVIRYGTDTSGRGIFMTRNLHAYWQAVLNSPRIRPFADKVTIVQSSWMVKNGGGAAASAGYHDYGGPLDVRTWNLTEQQIDFLIVAERLRGGAAWRRDANHGGFTPHNHLTIDNDGKMDSGVVWQFDRYEDGGWGSDGMHGYDYEWRPDPIRHWRWDRTPKRPKINLTVLQSAYARRRGRTFGKGMFIIRKFAKPLIEKGFLDNWHWKDATYGRNMREAVRKANKHYGITNWTGKHDDRVTWKLCRKLGFAPYKVEKKKKPKHRKVRAFTKTVKKVVR